MRSDAASLLFGVIISTVLAGTLVIAGLKAGITPGVSPLVILFAWGAFTAATRGAGGRRFLNIAQVAGSAGMAVTAGVIFVAPMIQILHADLGLPVPPVDVASLAILSLAGALIGYGFVGLGTRKFLTDPTLPAPEARACQVMIETAVTEAGRRPRLGSSLYLGLVASFLAPLLVAIGAAVDKIKLYANKDPERPFSVDLPFMPIYIGIGGLLTLSTAVLVFGGASLRLVGDWWVAGLAGTDQAAAYPASSMRWVGGAAMTVAVGYSLLRFMRPRGGERYDTGDEALLEIDRGKLAWLRVTITVGVAILVGWLVWQDGPTPFAWTISATTLGIAAVMVTLGAILSLQIGSSASPVSGTIFVTTLILCVVARVLERHEISDVLLLAPILTGACVAVCTANDSSQDYKTLQLCGVRVQDGFLAQLLGLLLACLVVPAVLYVAHEAYVLGSDALPAPQGKLFATLTTGLLIEGQLPWAPIRLGLVLGVLAVAMDVWGSRRGMQLPAMALAVGIYLPAYLGVGILIGALFRRVAEGPGGAQRNESLLAAAGLITGAAFFELLLGIGILGGLQPEALVLMSTDGTAGASVPTALPVVVAALGILSLGLILYVNSRTRRE